MEASAKLERLDRQQLVDLLEEHHAALRMSAPCQICQMPVACATEVGSGTGFFVWNRRMLKLFANSLDSYLITYTVLHFC